MKKQLTFKEKGNKYFKQGEYALASAMYKKHVSKPHQDNKNAYSNLGLCYFKMEKYDQCIEVCKQALRIDPDYSKVYYRLALAHNKIGNQYQVFSCASSYINLSAQNRQLQDYKEMNELKKKAQQKLLYPAPIQFNGGKDNIFYSHLYEKQKQSNKQNNKQAKKQKNQQQTTFKGYTWADVQKSINNDQLKLALNQAYQIMLNASKVKNKQAYEQNFAKVKNIALGKMPKETQIIIDQSILQSKPLLKITENQNQQKQTQIVQKPIQNGVKQQLKQEKVPTKTQQPPQQKDIYKKYFLNPLVKKLDIFEGFPTLIISLLKNKNIEKASLQQILMKASKQYQMFMALQLSMSPKQKSQIKEQMKKLKMANQLIDIYCS